MPLALTKVKMNYGVFVKIHINREEGNASLFFCVFFVRPSLGEDFRFLIANTHTYNAHAILRNMGISWLHTRWTPKPPSIHTLTHTKSFWQELHHHGNKTQKREALAQLVYSNHRESRKKERVVQLDRRGLGGGEHREWRSEEGGTQEQDFMLKVSRKHETVFSFMHFLCVNWIWPSRTNLKSAGSTTSKWEKRGVQKQEDKCVVSTTGSVSLQSLKVKQAAEVGAPSWLDTSCWLSKYIHVGKKDNKSAEY